MSSFRQQEGSHFNFSSPFHKESLFENRCWCLVFGCGLSRKHGPGGSNHCAVIHFHDWYRDSTLPTCVRMACSAPEQSYSPVTWFFPYSGSHHFRNTIAFTCFSLSNPILIMLYCAEKETPWKILLICHLEKSPSLTTHLPPEWTEQSWPHFLSALPIHAGR